MTTAITDKERLELQTKMWDKLEALIDRLFAEKRINLVEYTIARDVLYDTTELHEEIDYDNNIAQDFIDDEEMFISGLHAGYLAMKEKYPDVDTWSADDITDCSTDFRDYCY